MLLTGNNNGFQPAAGFHMSEPIIILASDLQKPAAANSNSSHLGPSHCKVVWQQIWSKVVYYTTSFSEVHRKIQEW